MISVLGSAGQLGSAFARLLGPSASFLTRADLDLRHLDAVGAWVDRQRPTTIINCAAYTAVDAAQSDEETARDVNALAVGVLARACAGQGSKLVTFSTDYVFDGEAEGGYTESSTPNPLNAYGRTKLEGEELALAAGGEALIVRTSWVMSATHSSFASKMLRLISQGQVRVVDDQRGRPTFTDDLARATLAAMESEASGILHLTNQGETTWFGLAREIAEVAALPIDRVIPCSTSNFPRPARRPPNSVLNSERLADLGIPPMRHYREPLQEAVRQLQRDS